jgi:phosphoenolpyruvate carboxylase
LKTLTFAQYLQHILPVLPGSVLGIINDLTDAIRQNNLLNIELLAQLGKTPFIQNEKPNPFDEAVSLISILKMYYFIELSEAAHEKTHKDN